MSLENLVVPETKEINKHRKQKQKYHDEKMSEGHKSQLNVSSVAKLNNLSKKIYNIILLIKL